MPLTNIIDRRGREFRFKKINAVAEATWHDNRCKDADHIEPSGGPAYEEREHISLSEAIAWAQSFEAPVTLYIYDENDGIYSRSEDILAGSAPTPPPPLS